MRLFYATPGYLHWFTFVLLLFSLTAQSQTKQPATGPVVRFGQVYAQDLQTDPYPQDATAEAVVLYDYGSFKLDMEGGRLYIITHYYVRIKIRRKSAYDRATVSRVLRKGRDGEQEHIDELEGYTYNLVDGAVESTKLDKSGIFLEKVSDQVSLQKFTLPNVREGAIIEYSYTLYTPFSVSNNPNTWTFQQHIPVLWSELNALIPNYSQYKIITSGYLPMAVDEHRPSTCTPLPGHTTNGATQYRLAVKDAPAFRPEAYITTESDYISKVDFELSSFVPSTGGRQNISLSWDALDATLLSEPSFGGQFRKANFLSDVAQLIKKQNSSPQEQISAAHQYISHTIKWDGTPGLTSASIKKVFEARKGDAGDINLMLIGLLNELDFDANPVILSTRSHGRVDESFALLKKFNYVIAHITFNGKDLLLDATDPYLRPGMLPFQCLNGTGRLVHRTKGRFVSLLPAERDIEVIAATFKLDDEGELSGTIDQSYGGYNGLKVRDALGTKGHAKFIDTIRKSKIAWHIEDVTLQNVDSIARPLNVSYKLKIPEACQLAGDRLYLRPMLTEGHTDNKFKEPQRLYPVDFGAPIDETYVATFTLPKGMVVEEAPKTALIVLPDNGGRFTYQVAVTGDQVLVTSRVSIRKPVYHAQEYPLLREFYDKILAKHAEQIVMKRGTIADKK